MKIQKILSGKENSNYQRKNEPVFEAGKTSLFSDFDGTLIPNRFSHDSVCNYTPPVNIQDFKTYFNKVWTLFGKLKGNEKESKFDFIVTTGRNIHETNYYLNKLREQDLWVPLPEKLITCNGQDEFYRTMTEDEYYKTRGKHAFVKENVNQEKRDYYKSKGWDYEKLVSALKEAFLEKKHYDMKVKFKDKEGSLIKCVMEHLCTIDSEKITNLLKEIEKNNLNEQEIRKLLEKNSKAVVTPEKKNDYDWYMGELAYIIHQEINRPRPILENIPTTRSSHEYGGGISLQHALEKIGMTKDNDFFAFSDDGELGIRVAVSDKYLDNYSGKMVNMMNIQDATLRNYDITKSKFHKGTYGGRELRIIPGLSDKFADTKKLVEEIFTNKTNDLVIVAGDGSNDEMMLDVENYAPATALEAVDQIEKFNNIPLVSILIDNRTEKEISKGKFQDLLAKESRMNYDKRLRFIHVDPTDPSKPQSLEEAIRMAVCDYAQHNPEFRKNLSPEMQKMADEYKFTYPVDEEAAKRMKEDMTIEGIQKQFFKNRAKGIWDKLKQIVNLEKNMNIENIEDVALDGEAEIPASVRRQVLSALCTIVATLKSLKEAFPEPEVLTTKINSYLENAKKFAKTDLQKKQYLKLDAMLTGKKTYELPSDIRAFVDNAKNVTPKKPEVKLPEVKTPEGIREGDKTPEDKKPDGKTPEGKTPKGNPEGGKPPQGGTPGGEKKPKKKTTIEKIKEFFNKHTWAKKGAIIAAGLLAIATVAFVAKHRNNSVQEKNKIETIQTKPEKTIINNIERN